MYLGHFDKVKESCMFKETEEFAGIDLKIERNLTEKERKLRRNKFKTERVSR